MNLTAKNNLKPTDGSESPVEIYSEARTDNRTDTKSACYGEWSLYKTCCNPDHIKPYAEKMIK
jgi:hypothetical protein